MIKKVRRTRKQSMQSLEGDGLGDFFSNIYDKAKSTATKIFGPRLNGFNNISQKTINELGQKPVVSLAIYRTPINSMINKALNFISFGKWDKLKQKHGFDRLFHLALIATVNVGGGVLKNVIMEKNEVVNVTTSYNTDHQTEVFNIDLQNKNMTPAMILDTARKNVGDYKFFSYDAFNNNCQYFIKYLLEGVGLYTEDAKNFLFQDLSEVIKGLPSYIGQVANAVTTTGAVVSKLSGKGEAEQIKQASRSVIQAAKSVPGLGEAVEFLGEPIGAVTDLFVDNVISPLFLDKRKAQISKDWAEYVKEASKSRYGSEMTPEQFMQAKHSDLIDKTNMKNQQFSQGMDDFERRARLAGFKSTAEYSKYLRDSNRQTIKARKMKGGALHLITPEMPEEDAMKIKNALHYLDTKAENAGFQNAESYMSEMRTRRKLLGRTKLEGGAAPTYELHTVVVKKDVPLDEARKIAKEFIKGKQKFMRETEGSYRFRNIPKSKFKARKYRSKIVNDNVTLVYGELRDSP